MLDSGSSHTRTTHCTHHAHTLHAPRTHTHTHTFNKINLGIGSRQLILAFSRTPALGNTGISFGMKLSTTPCVLIVAVVLVYISVHYAPHSLYEGQQRVRTVRCICSNFTSNFTTMRAANPSLASSTAVAQTKEKLGPTFLLILVPTLLKQLAAYHTKVCMICLLAPSTPFSVCITDHFT